MTPFDQAGRGLQQLREVGSCPARRSSCRRPAARRGGHTRGKGAGVASIGLQTRVTRPGDRKRRPYMWRCAFASGPQTCDRGQLGLTQGLGAGFARGQLREEVVHLFGCLNDENWPQRCHHGFGAGKLKRLANPSDSFACARPPRRCCRHSRPPVRCRADRCRESPYRSEFHRCCPKTYANCSRPVRFHNAIMDYRGGPGATARRYLRRPG